MPSGPGNCARPPDERREMDMGMKPLALLIREAVEYTDRGGVPLSSWDKYVLPAGVYRFEPVTVDHEPVREGQEPYYLRVRIEAELIETYRMARVFSAADAQTDQPMVLRLVTFAPYASKVTPGGEAFTGIGEIVEMQACGECKAAPEQDCVEANCQGRWV